MNWFGCEGITRLYENKPVVEGITLSLQQGEVGCLLGPSGVGKTTLMSVLSGLDKPDTGKVYLDGTDITGKPGHVSYMLQKDLLLPYKTILDNISLPLRLQGEKKQNAREHAQTYLEDFGLAGCESMYPHQLSGGMRQRAALLRTYLAGSRIMLLDEPFSALDAITKRQMHTWYLDIIQRMDVTTLLITHDVDEALILSDSIYILNGVPGHVTKKLLVHPLRPRCEDFATSEDFIQQKKEVLTAIASIPSPAD